MFDILVHIFWDIFLYGDYLVLMGAIMRKEMTIEWLKKCIELLA